MNLIVNMGTTNQEPSIALSNIFNQVCTNFDWYKNMILKSKFYKTRLFTDLPFINYKILNQYYYSFSHPNIEGGTCYTTSGTTLGVRKKIFYSATDEKEYIKQRTEIFKNIIKNENIHTACADLGIGHASSSAMTIFETLGLNSKIINHSSPILEHIRILNKYLPELLFTMPVILDKLIITGELDIHPKKIVVLGDVISTKWKEYVASFFNISTLDITDIYGSIEVGSIAYECHTCGLYHFSKNIIPEIISINNKTGILVITSVTRSYFPAIRYVTDDVIEDFQKVTCNNTKHFAFKKILGRNANELKHGEKLSHYEVSETIHNHIPGALYECYSEGNLIINIYSKHQNKEVLDFIKSDLKRNNPSLSEMINAGLVGDIKISFLNTSDELVQRHKRVFNIFSNL